MIQIKNNLERTISKSKQCIEWNTGFGFTYWAS